MSFVLAAATRGGAHTYEQPVVQRQVQAWLEGAGRAASSAARSFDRSQVERRTSVEPLELVFRRRGLGDSNDLYRRHAVELATAVVGDCLRQAGRGPAEIDAFISVSCTGVMIPSLDAVVAEDLAMKRSLRRLPVTEHGCAAGAVALSLAHDHLQAHPQHLVLIVSVELPSLTFQAGDRSPANVVSSSLFGDGAAAVLVAGSGGGPRIVRTASHRFPDSLDWMGFDLRDSGFHIRLSPRVPEGVRGSARRLVEGFLAEDGLTLADVRHFLLHPGGRKILEAFEETLGLSRDELAVSRRVLRENGNLSSATVLYILKEYLDRGLGRCGDLGLLMAFGPGFSAELVLLRWED